MAGVLGYAHGPQGVLGGGFEPHGVLGGYPVPVYRPDLIDPRGGVMGGAMVLPTMSIGQHAAEAGKRMAGRFGQFDDALWGRAPMSLDDRIGFVGDVALALPGGALALPPVKGAAGMGIRAYHGSPHDFSKFDPGKARTAKHIYLTPHKDDAAKYGKNVIEVEVEGKVGDFRPEMRGPDEMAALRRAYDPENGFVSDYFDSFEEFVEAFDNGDMYQRFANSKAQDAVMDALLDQGYDALYVPDAGFGGGMSESIVVRNPEVVAILKKYGLAGLGVGGAAALSGYTDGEIY